jgi:putative Mn2+ efflux pump MntP
LLLIKHSAGDAVTYFGIALAFDPFDQNQPWKERPNWQKAVLIFHIVFILFLFGYMIGNTASDVKRGFMEGFSRK